MQVASGTIQPQFDLYNPTGGVLTVKLTAGQAPTSNPFGERATA